jgi:hypothetical protein
VSQATLRIVKVFWGLSANLAYRRHFPAIDWLTSYSLYADALSGWFDDNVWGEWSNMRGRALVLLQEEAELEEIVRLVGMDALSIGDRLKIEAARSLREDFLQQNAFHEADTYTSGNKQAKMLDLVFRYYDLAKSALEDGADFSAIPDGDMSLFYIPYYVLTLSNPSSFPVIADTMSAISRRLPITVVWCSKAPGAQNMRVVGFYKNATVFREPQYAEFDNGYVQEYNFIAKKEDCVLLPYRERHSNCKWYVPSSQKGQYSFGFGRSNIWYASGCMDDSRQLEYIEKMILSIDDYNGENWIDKGGAA